MQGKGRYDTSLEALMHLRDRRLSEMHSTMWSNDDFVNWKICELWEITSEYNFGFSFFREYHKHDVVVRKEHLTKEQQI